MADLILGWNILIGCNETSAILIDRYTNILCNYSTVQANGWSYAAKAVCK
jgi:hypothetical protein